MHLALKINLNDCCDQTRATKASFMPYRDKIMVQKDKLAQITTIYQRFTNDLPLDLSNYLGCMQPLYQKQLLKLLIVKIINS